jgi:hypothetical protein
MRFLGLLKADQHSEAGQRGDPEMMQRMGKFMEAITKAGVLVETGGLQPSANGKRVRLADGKVTVIDGPFTESKELVASYAILETPTMAEAVDWTTRFLQVLGRGDCELRPIYEGPSGPPPR